MLVHTKQTIHLGVGCIFTPQPVLDASHSLSFQGELAAHGLTFTQTNTPPGALVLSRDPRLLEVRLQQMGPAVGSLVVIAPAPWATLDEFLDEAKTAFNAYGAAWPGEQLQVIQRECTIRQLYDVADDHAFKYLWEGRLECKQEELAAFGRPVLGGGLRFVIPPADDSGDEPITEVKVESYFPNLKKLFVEVQMKWGQPQVVAAMDPEPMLREADRFASEEVVAFITGGGQ